MFADILANPFLQELLVLFRLCMCFFSVFWNQISSSYMSYVSGDSVFMGRARKGSSESLLWPLASQGPATRRWVLCPPAERHRCSVLVNAARCLSLLPCPNGGSVIVITVFKKLFIFIIQIYRERRNRKIFYLLLHSPCDCNARVEPI